MNLTNYNISLPAGTTNHGDPHLLCPSASWLSVVVFFIGNYLSHAVTVKLPPAVSVAENFWICFTALLLPAAGLYYGLSAFSQAILGRHMCEVNRAAMAGALCMFVRSDKWQPPRNLSSFEADVHRLIDFTRPREPTGWRGRSRSLFPPTWSASMPQADKMMLLYRDVVDDPSGIQVFRRMEDVNEERLQQRQQRLETEGHEGAAEDGIELTQRDAEQSQIAVLRVKQSNHQQLIKLRPDPKVHGLKYSHPCYDLVYVPRDAIIDCAIPGKGLSEDNAAAQSSRPNSNDEIVDAPRSEPNPTEESTEVPTSRTIANESNIIEATSRANSSDAELATPLEEEGIHLSKDRGITKSLVAFFQLCFSTFTLVKSRANQIDVYGYAAFSLTVAPYAVMAAVNLLANIVQPTYPSLFLVRNDVMAEIEDAFAVHFDNTVGTVRQIEDPTQEERGVVPPYLNRFLLNHEMGELDQHHRVYGIPSTPPNAALQLMTPDQAVAQGVLPLGVISVDPCQRLETRRGSPNVRRGIIVLGVLLMAAPLVIVGCLSKFHNGTSSNILQRYVMMMWLVSGQIFGAFLAGYQGDRGSQVRSWFVNSAARKILITDELLQRLDINADQETRRKFESMVSRFELKKFAAMKPVVFLTRAFPEFQALSAYMYFAIVYNICGVAGFVIVGQMLLDYGDCIRIY